MSGRRKKKRRSGGKNCGGARESAEACRKMAEVRWYVLWCHGTWQSHTIIVNLQMHNNQPTINLRGDESYPRVGVIHRLKFNLFYLLSVNLVVGQQYPKKIIQGSLTSSSGKVWVSICTVPALQKSGTLVSFPGPKLLEWHAAFYHLQIYHTFSSYSYFLWIAVD